MSSLSITLIQTALYWEDKAANLQMLEAKIAAIEKPTHMVVLPEMFSTGFSMKPELLAETMDGTTVQWMRQMAVQRKIILTGSLIIEESGSYYNRLIWMLPNGQCSYYDKRHLFGYAGEDKKYTRGNRRFIASVNGWRAALQVCYDLRFPVWSRQNPFLVVAEGEERETAEYDLLLYVANWPQRRSTAWTTLLRARAIENQCYVIGVNRVGADGNGISHSGDSMVIDPLGEVLYHKADEEDIFTVTLNKASLEEVRAKFPFLQDADPFKIIRK